MIDHLVRRDELDGIGRLLEKKRRFARRVRAHFARMRRVIAADAIDPADREDLARARYRNRRLRQVKAGFPAGAAPCSIADKEPLALAPPGKARAAFSMLRRWTLAMTDLLRSIVAETNIRSESGQMHARGCAGTVGCQPAPGAPGWAAFAKGFGALTQSHLAVAHAEASSGEA